MSKVRSIETLLLDGGTSCFNFINTVSTRSADDEPYEYLESYEKLLKWSERIELLTEKNRKKLRAYAEAHPAEAVQALADIIEVREMLYRFFSAVAAGQAVKDPDLVAFNEWLSKSLAKLRFSRGNGSLSLDWEAGEPDLREPLYIVMKNAYDILTEESFDRIKECEACGWVFLDQSKNKSRRWCNMQTCGSIHKAKKYYHRKKDEEESDES